MGKIHRFLSVDLFGQVMTLRGQILVSRADDDTALPSVCGFKKSPCMLAPRAHVETHVRVVPVHTGTFLNLHTKVFSGPHHTTHTAQHTPTRNTTQNHTRTSHGERGKEKEKEKKKKKKKGKKKKEKRKEKKRKEKKRKEKKRKEKKKKRKRKEKKRKEKKRKEKKRKEKEKKRKEKKRKEKKRKEKKRKEKKRKEKKRKEKKRKEKKRKEKKRKKRKEKKRKEKKRKKRKEKKRKEKKRKEKKRKEKKRKEKKRKEKKRKEKNAPTETGPLLQSLAQELFVIRVRGHPSLRLELLTVCLAYCRSVPRMKIPGLASPCPTIPIFMSCDVNLHALTRDSESFRAKSNQLAQRLKLRQIQQNVGVQHPLGRTAHHMRRPVVLSTLRIRETHTAATVFSHALWDTRVCTQVALECPVVHDNIQKKKKTSTGRAFW